MPAPLIDAFIASRRGSEAKALRLDDCSRVRLARKRYARETFEFVNVNAFEGF